MKITVHTNPFDNFKNKEDIEVDEILSLTAINDDMDDYREEIEFKKDQKFKSYTDRSLLFVMETPEEINKMIENTKFNNTFEELLDV